ncbi:2-phosphosulfolactate phosphatase [Castellaniella sp. WN]
MRKIHLVLSKEALRSGHHANACAIVLDIIFATTSMTAALDAGARQIIPALDLDEARSIGSRLNPADRVLAGERDAEPFRDGVPYDPIALSNADIADRDLIYATTNGTVALRRSSFFKQTYAASLRNGLAVVQHVVNHTDTEDIVLVCSGSKGKFSLEDFYGAGHLAHWLEHCLAGSIRCNDAAQAAQMAYRGSAPLQVLMDSRIGRIMRDRGLASSLEYASQLDCSTAVPRLENGRIRDVSAHTRAARRSVRDAEGKDRN